MATDILSQIQESCPRDFEVIKNTLANKSQEDSLKNMIENHSLWHSFYAKPLQNGVLPRSDIIVGFVVNTPTTFTLSIEPNTVETNTVEPITLKKSLNEGEFQFAFYDNPYPRIRTLNANLTISDINGSGYVIYAELDTPQRRILGTSEIELGDYCFKYGNIIPRN